MMENEALNVLKMIEAHGCLAIEAKEVAIKSLEKQIPKKPYVKSSDYDFKGYYCPCCDGYVRSVHTRIEIIREEDIYCGRCGQKLDWE